MQGELWRDVVNFLGDDEPTPDDIMPLLDLVAGHHADVGDFLRWLPEKLEDPRDREELDEQLQDAAIGWRIWQDHRAALQAWADAGEDGPVPPLALEDWWFDDSSGHILAVDEVERLGDLLARVPLDPADAAVVQDRLSGDLGDRWFLRRMRQSLRWVRELATLTRLAYKTWPAEVSQRQPWTREELALVESYYSDQQPLLVPAEGDDVETIDPFHLLPINVEQNVGFGASELTYCMTVLLRATVIDFMEEILDTARFPQVRGSLQCVECGTFVGRRALGYGQLYCDDRCKKRAAKRRYRSRVNGRRYHR